MSLGVVPQRSFDLSDRHAAAISPIDVASVSLRTVPAKKIWVCICQKLPHFLLAKLPTVVL
jgi:hypothetical protein